MRIVISKPNQFWLHICVIRNHSHRVSGEGQNSAAVAYNFANCGLQRIRVDSIIGTRQCTRKLFCCHCDEVVLVQFVWCGDILHCERCGEILHVHPQVPHDVAACEKDEVHVIHRPHRDIADEFRVSNRDTTTRDTLRATKFRRKGFINLREGSANRFPVIFLPLVRWIGVVVWIPVRNVHDATPPVHRLNITRLTRRLSGWSGCRFRCLI